MEDKIERKREREGKKERERRKERERESLTEGLGNVDMLKLLLSSDVLYSLSNCGISEQKQSLDTSGKY